MQTAHRMSQEDRGRLLEDALAEEDRLHNLLRTNWPELPNYDPGLGDKWLRALAALNAAALALRKDSDPGPRH
jgi:hypothetical protein